ncbi:hypothetical protein [Thalassospira xiamenensis]|uniref:Uncharacterized protein n=1 Tax=Thalassospira xiamenensis TaxID=220697 RepID=A0A285TXI5_9PROT|nr:hypothetical protein [Thalassospira xiamenensis]SOC30549.1 hypothetical protein SAMN05428964_10997 [Thalassospira xiamenensis]
MGRPFVFIRAEQKRSDLAALAEQYGIPSKDGVLPADRLVELLNQMTQTLSDEAREGAAKVVARDVGLWENWDSPDPNAVTPNGNSPDEEREGWRETVDAVTGALVSDKVVAE